MAALDTAHNVSFRNGLGNPLFASRPVSLGAVKAYAANVFTKENVAVIGSGVSETTLAQLVQNKAVIAVSQSPITSTGMKHDGYELSA